MPGPGQPFNLDELLGEKHVRHYLRFIEGASHEFVVSAGDGYSWVDTPLSRVPVITEQFSPPVASEVAREGTGPDTCSPSGVLQTIPQWVWDVCGYYRRLGVPWNATRGQLLQAYRERAGHDQLADPEGALAYALHQLLSPRIRRAYDLTPLGTLFMWDRPTQEQLKRDAARRASQETAERGSPVSANEVLEAWGMKRPEGEAAELPVSAPAGDEGQRCRETLGASAELRWRLNWSWYERGACSQPIEWLEAWQYLLITAFRDNGINVGFGIGFCADREPDILPPQRDRPLLCLLGTRPPSHEQALKAIVRVKAIAAKMGRYRLCRISPPGPKRPSSNPSRVLSPAAFPSWWSRKTTSSPPSSG